MVDKPQPQGGGMSFFPGIAGARTFLVRYRELLVTIAGLAILLLALIALHALLGDLHSTDIVAALRRIDTWHWLAALGFTLLSFTCLTLYDFCALRTLGASTPYPVAARTAMLSYAISNMTGLSLLTGGAIRLRLYSRAGLPAAEVGRVILLASGTFWAGVFVLFGAVMLWQTPPIRLGGFAVPILVQYGIGLLILLLVALYLLATARRPRQLRAGALQLPLPPPRIALIQLGTAALDLACSAAVLFLLLPDLALAYFPMVLAAYVLALGTAVLTHTPGGLGVFEAMMLLALPQIEAGTLAAALIGYRLVYYLLPFCIATLVLLISEGAALRRHAAPVLGQGRRIASSLAPAFMGMSVFAAGSLLLVTGTLPSQPDHVSALARWMPVLAIDLSHLAASLIGTVLLFVAYGLYRRQATAHRIACVLVALAIPLALARGYDLLEAGVLGVVMLLLAWTRPAFYRRSGFSRAPLSPGLFLAVSTVLIASSYIGFFVYKHVDYSNALWWQISLHGDAPRHLRASLASAVLALGIGLWHLFSRSHQRAQNDPLPADVWQRALTATDNSTAHLARTGDKRFLIAPEGDAFLMYQVQGRSWIAMSDPVGPEARWPALLWALREQADQHQGRLVVYECSAALLPLTVDLGLGVVKLGEEARVPLTGFSLDGSDRKALRQAVNRCHRAGFSFEVLEGSAVTAALPQLARVSDSWLITKGQTEKRFSLGRFDTDYLLGGPVAVARQGDTLLAFANLWTLPGKQELSIDLMRHSADAPGGIMDFLFAELMRWGHAQGYGWFSLGMAPLSGIQYHRLAPLWTHLANALYRHGERLYGYEGLRRYKDKYHPVWSSRYLAAPHGAGLAAALLDVTLLVSGPGRRRT